MEIVKLDNISDLNLDELIDTEGGGFAYDVGRAIRLAYLNGVFGTQGYIQWHAERLANDAYQKMN